MSERPRTDQPRVRWLRRGDLAWAIGLVAGAIAIWRLHVVGTGTVLSPMMAGDGFSYFLPAYVYETERLQAGAFPFWNPYQGAGVPFVATLQPGALYPARLLTLLTTPGTAMGWSAFAHVLLGLLATYALCRRLDATAAAGALGAIVFTTAFALPSITGPTVLEPGVWLPVVALATVEVVSGGGWSWVVVLGLVAAMPPLAGGYQMTLYTVYGAGLFAMAVALERSARVDSRVLVRLAVAGALALATASPQILTTLAWSADTVRKTKPLTVTQMMPIFTDSVRLHRLALYFFRTSPTDFGYFSVPVLALAAIGLVRSRPLGLVLGLGALVTAALPLIPPTSTLFGIYTAIPGFAMFRFPLRLLVLTSLLVGVGAALGLSMLVRWRVLATPVRRAVVQAAALSMAVVLLVWPFRNDYVMPWNADSALAKPDPSFFPPATRPPAGERVYVPGDRFELRLGAFVRQGTLQHVRVLQDYEPLSSRRLATFLSAVAGLPPPGEDAVPPFSGSVRAVNAIARPALLDLVGVSTVLTLQDTLAPEGIAGWTKIATFGPFATYRNARTLPRAYVVGRARFVADENVALDTAMGRDFDPRREVVLVGPGPGGAASSDAPEGVPFVPAGIAIDEPERVVVEVDAASPGYLVLADAFASGWEATVDGVSRPIWQANYMVRAVELHPGDRRVEFRYRAPGFALGITVLVLTWSAVLGGLAIARLRRRRGGPAG